MCVCVRVCIHTSIYKSLLRFKMQRMSSPYLNAAFHCSWTASVHCIAYSYLPQDPCVMSATSPSPPARPVYPEHPVALPEIQVGLTETVHNCSGYKLCWVTVLRMVLLLGDRVYKTS